jgi:hypothetical protein
MGNLLFTSNSVAGYGGQKGSAGGNLGAGPALGPGPGSNSGNLDIIRNFRWTLTDSIYALNEVPYVYLTEYRYLQNQISAQNTSTLSPVQAAAASVGTNTNDPYKGLYDHTVPSGFTYTIPYFDDTMFDANSNWTSIDSGLPSIAAAGKVVLGAGGAVVGSRFGGAIGGTTLEQIGEGIGSTIGGAADYLATLPARSQNPKVGIIDSPKLWQNTTERSYTIQFPLLNTASEDDIQRNWELCYLLSYQNLFNKKTYFTAIPPVYYEVYIPGVHYSKASYVSHLKIQNKGNIRNLTYDWSGTNQNYNIPDCFVVTMTLTDLLMPSQNQMYLINTGVVSTDTAYAQQLASAIEKNQAVTNIVNTITPDLNNI